MDVLSDVIKFLRIKESVTRRAELTAPWGLRRGECDTHNAFYFMVVRGGCYLQIDGSPNLTALRAGDLVMSPKGAEVVLMDAPGSPITSVQEITQSGEGCEVCKFGGGGHSTTLVLGYFELDSAFSNPLINALPRILDLRADGADFEVSMELISRLLATELSESKPGSEIFITRLTYLVFFQIIRTYMSQEQSCKTSTGWLKALTDPEIGRALCLIHEQPHAPWTVASLAQAVGLSRTSFATKFSEMVQTPPVDYLTTWRMQKAQYLLYDADLNVGDVAATVGYQSEGAFTKAFKRETGQSPIAFKKELLKNEREAMRTFYRMTTA